MNSQGADTSAAVRPMQRGSAVQAAKGRCRSHRLIKFDFGRGKAIRPMPVPLIPSGRSFACEASRKLERRSEQDGLGDVSLFIGPQPSIFDTGQNLLLAAHYSPTLSSFIDVMLGQRAELVLGAMKLLPALNHSIFPMLCCSLHAVQRDGAFGGYEAEVIGPRSQRLSEALAADTTMAAAVAAIEKPLAPDEQAAGQAAVQAALRTTVHTATQIVMKAATALYSGVIVRGIDKDGVVVPDPVYGSAAVHSGGAGAVPPALRDVFLLSPLQSRVVSSSSSCHTVIAPRSSDTQPPEAPLDGLLGMPTWQMVLAALGVTVLGLFKPFLLAALDRHSAITATVKGRLKSGHVLCCVVAMWAVSGPLERNVKAALQKLLESGNMEVLGQLGSLLAAVRPTMSPQQQAAWQELIARKAEDTTSQPDAWLRQFKEELEQSWTQEALAAAAAAAAQAAAQQPAGGLPRVGTKRREPEPDAPAAALPSALPPGTATSSSDPLISAVLEASVWHRAYACFKQTFNHDAAKMFASCIIAAVRAEQVEAAQQASAVDTTGRAAPRYGLCRPLRALFSLLHEAAGRPAALAADLAAVQRLLAVLLPPCLHRTAAAALHELLRDPAAEAVQASRQRVEQLVREGMPLEMAAEMEKQLFARTQEARRFGVDALQPERDFLNKDVFGARGRGLLVRLNDHVQRFVLNMSRLAAKAAEQGREVHPGTLLRLLHAGSIMEVAMRVVGSADAVLQGDPQSTVKNLARFWAVLTQQASWGQLPPQQAGASAGAEQPQSKEATAQELMRALPDMRRINRMSWLFQELSIRAVDAMRRQAEQQQQQQMARTPPPPQKRQQQGQQHPRQATPQPEAPPRSAAAAQQPPTGTPASQPFYRRPSGMTPSSAADGPAPAHMEQIPDGLQEVPKDLLHLFIGQVDQPLPYRYSVGPDVSEQADEYAASASSLDADTVVIGEDEADMFFDEEEDDPDQLDVGLEGWPGGGGAGQAAPPAAAGQAAAAAAAAAPSDAQATVPARAPRVEARRYKSPAAPSGGDGSGLGAAAPGPGPSNPKATCTLRSRSPAAAQAPSGCAAGAFGAAAQEAGAFRMFAREPGGLRYGAGDAAAGGAGAGAEAAGGAGAGGGGAVGGEAAGGAAAGGGGAAGAAPPPDADFLQSLLSGLTSRFGDIALGGREEANQAEPARPNRELGRARRVQAGRGNAGGGGAAAAAAGSGRPGPPNSKRVRAGQQRAKE